MAVSFVSILQFILSQTQQQARVKSVCTIGIMGLITIISPTVNAILVYQVTTPKGRMVTVNNPTKAYQLNPDTSKIVVIDTDSFPSSPLADINPMINTVNTATPPSSTPPSSTTSPSTPYIPPTYTTTTTTNGDTTTKTITVNQPMTTPMSAEATHSSSDDFEELNISSTRASKQGDYQLTLLTPTPETLYHKPAQSIEVSLAVKPALRKGDTLNIIIDGHVVKNGKALSYQIPTTDINPDKHTLTVTVLNVLNKPIATTETSFYLIQNTPLIQKKRQLQTQLAAYDALPWDEKLRLQLGFESNKDNTPKPNQQ